MDASVWITIALTLKVALWATAINLVLVIEVISERRVNIGKPETVAGTNLLDTLSHLLMPDGDILDCDAMSRDPGFAASDAGSALDVPVETLKHHARRTFRRRSNR